MTRKACRIFLFLFQQELTDPEYHRWLNESSAEHGKSIGISESFVRFLRDIPQLADRIGNLQPTDAVLNSFDRRVLNMNLTYQFALLTGERIYINPYMINVLRVLQDEVEQYIQKKLNEYEPIIEQDWKSGSTVIDDETYTDEYFRKKAQELKSK